MKQKLRNQMFFSESLILTSNKYLFTNGEIIFTSRHYLEIQREKSNCFSGIVPKFRTN